MMVRSYAHVRGGRVVAVGDAVGPADRPFLDVPMQPRAQPMEPTDERVVEVIGVPCRVGDLVDRWENFSPAPPEPVSPLGKQDAAYHDRRHVPAPNTAEVMARLRR